MIVGLALAGGQQQAAPRLEDRAHAHGDARAAASCPSPPKSGAFCARVVGRQRLHARARAQGGKRLVEADVAGLADAQQLQVDAAEALDERFVARGTRRPGRPPCRRADACSAGRCSPAGTGDGPCNGGRSSGRTRQADVFVQVERAAEREIQLLLPVHRRTSMPVHRLHRAARGQPQHQVRVGAQFLGDDAAPPAARPLRCVRAG